MAIWVVVVELCSICSPAMSLIQFNDGGTYNISTTINDEVWVDYEASGMETTFNFLSGGSITGGGSITPNELEGYEDSHINIFGGTINDDLLAWDNCKVDFSGGVIGASLSANDNSRVFFSGGAMVNVIYAAGYSQITVSGGSIVYNLIARQNSQVTISGGLISGTNEALWVHEDSRTIVSGGIIEGNIILQNRSCIEFIGRDFAIDGIPFDYGEYNANSVSANYGVLTGTLGNGDYLNNKLVFYDDSSIILTPEPSTFLLLGLGAVMLTKKR